MTKVPDQSSGAASSPASQMDIGRIEGRRVYHNNKSLKIVVDFENTHILH